MQGPMSSKPFRNNVFLGVVKNYAKSDIRVICSCAISLFSFKTLSVIVGISKKAVYANDLLSKGGDFDQEINLWFRCWSSE